MTTLRLDSMSSGVVSTSGSGGSTSASSPVPRPLKTCGNALWSTTRRKVEKPWCAASGMSVSTDWRIRESLTCCETCGSAELATVLPMNQATSSTDRPLMSAPPRASTTRAESQVTLLRTRVPR